MGLRRKGREIAVQTLYSLEYLELDSFLRELEFLEKYPQKLIEIATDRGVEEGVKEFNFADSILKGLIQNIDEIDEQISKHSTHWTIDKIAYLDKSVLRIAIYEILFTSTPHPIVMNEAIEIAKKYCSESSAKFINGILNATSKELK
ncbi:MAG: transcription antitermination factor NusB [Candidatus Cloacimonetes bacterium]|nr:transcription antitermination factor NusB [Candidatus Cloacimonadota bacterium]